MKNSTPFLIEGEFCVEILMKDFSSFHIKIYDLCLLIPSSIFFVFLLFNIRKICGVLLNNNSFIINTLYFLLCFASALKILRSILAIVSKDDSIVDKTLWLIVRFFLLSIEMSIVTFGVATARLDNRAEIRRVLLVTSFISLTYTIIQATLEFTRSGKRFNNSYTFYGHGGSLFFLVSSVMFFFIYVLILILPFTPVSRRVRLPTKKFFYVYCGILAVLYFIEAVGSLMFYLFVKSGLCVIDITTFIYFAFYDPLVYATFLHSYFSRSSRNLTFKSDDYTIEYPVTYSDDGASYSSTAVSTNYNYNYNGYGKPPKHRLAVNDGEDDHETASVTQYHPDNTYFIMDQGANIEQIMEDFYILPDGARMDYAVGRPASSTMGSEATVEEAVDNIVSLGYEQDSWNMGDFVSKK